MTGQRGILQSSRDRCARQHMYTQPSFMHCLTCQGACILAKQHCKIGVCSGALGLLKETNWKPGLVKPLANA